MKGAPLHRLLQMNKCFKPKLVRYIIYQITDFLEYLEEEGVLYRDLKASNLLLDDTGVVKLIDFGLSKEIGKEKTDSICGTAHSLPPEIYTPGGYDYKVDIFSLGILTFELLTGYDFHTSLLNEPYYFRKPPFGYLKNFEEVKTVYEDNAVEKLLHSPESDFPNIDETAKDFICQLTKTHPDERPSLTEIANHEFL